MKFTGTFNPVDASAAVIERVNAELACNTMMSTTTSDFGLSRSLMIRSAKDTRSASPRTMIAFCEL